MKQLTFLYVVLAGVLFGTSCIFVNLLSPYGFTPLQMIAMRGGVAGIVMSIAVLFYDKKLFKIDLKGLIGGMLCGVGIYSTAATYFIAMDKTSVSTAVMLMYTAPVFVLVYSVIFLNESFTKQKALAVTLVMAGSCLVSGIMGGFKFDIAGLLIGLLSGVSYAFYNIVTKTFLKKGYNPLSITLYCFITMGVLSVSFGDIGGLVQNTAKKPISIIPLIIGIGVMTCVLPYFLHTLGLRKLPAGIAASLGIVEPMSATLFSVVLFKEKLTVTAAIGVVLILIAVVFLSRTSQDEKES